MKTNTAKKQKESAMSHGQLRRMAKQETVTIGLDLSDRSIQCCILDEDGRVASRQRIPNSAAGLRGLLEGVARCRVALEVGTHSPWVSRCVAELGHEVIVANPRKVKLITHSLRKTDRIDAEQLARLARADPKLLSPIRHRGVEVQADLAVIHARAKLVAVRSTLINTARGTVKPMGERLRACDADAAGGNLLEGLSEAARQAVEPLLRAVEALTEQIRVYDERIAELRNRYPETSLLLQVYGVGPLIALTFLLTIEDPSRFRHSRDVGPYLGLVPKEWQSGERQIEQGISKAGDELLRKLLVQGAHCMLRKGGKDSDLRRWGLARLEGKKGKSKVVVAMARKLAVLLHRLWVTGEVWDPLYQQQTQPQSQAA